MFIFLLLWSLVLQFAMRTFGVIENYVPLYGFSRNLLECYITEKY